MAENDKSEETKTYKAVYADTDSAPTFYANQINVAVSQFDMRLRFAVMGEPEGESITYKNLVTVYLAPGQARALRDLLNRKSDSYERVWAGRHDVKDE